MTLDACLWTRKGEKVFEGVQYLQRESKQIQFRTLRKIRNLIVVNFDVPKMLTFLQANLLQFTFPISIKKMHHDALIEIHE